MDIDVLEKREDLESVTSMAEALGWVYGHVGQDVQVFPNPEDSGVLVSRMAYRFCGVWVRPVYAKLSVETHMDVSMIGEALLQIATTELGSISVPDAGKQEGKMTIVYRVLVPADGELELFLEGCLAALYGMEDIRNWVMEIHRSGDH